MLKTGVIADGISRDFEHAADVMVESGLKFAELQYLWDKEVADLTTGEVQRVKAAVEARDLRISCISHHIFSGIPLLTGLDDPAYLAHLDTLRRAIDIAKALDTTLVRIFTFRKEMVLFGGEAITAKDGWQILLRKLEKPLQIAEDEDITLVVETGISSNVTSAALARKLIDELGSGRLKVLWDPCSSLYSTERPYPDAYETIRDDIAHIHLKDGIVNLPMATFHFCPLGEGDMQPYLEDIVAALKRDQYQGVISLEAVYIPSGGTQADGFRQSLPVFKRLLAD